MRGYWIEDGVVGGYYRRPHSFEGDSSEEHPGYSFYSPEAYYHYYRYLDGLYCDEDYGSCEEF